MDFLASTMTAANSGAAVDAFVAYVITSSARLSDYSNQTSRYTVVQNQFNNTLISEAAYANITTSSPYYLPGVDESGEHNHFNFLMSTNDEVPNGYECSIRFPNPALPNVTLRGYLRDEPLKQMFSIHRAGRTFLIEAELKDDPNTTALVASATHLPVEQGETWNASAEYVAIRFSLLEVMKKLQPNITAQLSRATLDRMRIEVQFELVNMWKADYDAKYAKTGVYDAAYNVTLLYADQFDTTCECNRNETQPIVKETLGHSTLVITSSVAKTLDDYVQAAKSHARVWIGRRANKIADEVQAWLNRYRDDVAEQAGRGWENRK